MCRRFVLGGVVCAVLGSAAGAYATGWPLEASAPVLCGYAAEYTCADGSRAVHTGMDIESQAGQNVVAVEPGTVTFAGRVPGSSGGTVLAVTVETVSGDKWSYLPLESHEVETGDVVGEGSVLGIVAGTGDASSCAPHVHIGLRRSERYIDPAPFLVAPTAAPTPEYETSPAGDTATHEAPQEVRPATVQEPASPSSAAAGSVGVTASSEQHSHGGTASSAAGSSVAAPGSEVPACATGDSGAPRVLQGARAQRAEQHSTAQAGGRSATPQSTPAPSSRGGTGAREARPYGAAVGLRALIAAALLAPVAGVGAQRFIRSRVRASGDAVAAAVGR